MGSQTAELGPQATDVASQETTKDGTVTVVGACPPQHQVAVLAVCGARGGMSAGFLTDRPEASATAWEERVTAMCIAMVSSHPATRHVKILTLRGSTNCEGGLLIRRARLVRAIRHLTSNDDLRVTVEMVHYDDFMDRYATTKERTTLGHHVTSVVSEPIAAAPKPEDDELSAASAEVMSPSETRDDRADLDEAAAREASTPKEKDILATPGGVNHAHTTTKIRRRGTRGTLPKGPGGSRRAVLLDRQEPWSP